MTIEPPDLLDIVNDDLVWANPLVDQAAAELDRGERVPAEEALGLIRKFVER